jgi:hypothetical protein
MGMQATGKAEKQVDNVTNNGASEAVVGAGPVWNTARIYKPLYSHVDLLTRSC